MKRLLILGGGSTRNIAWGEACEEFFKKDFDVVHFMHYDHWQTGESNVDFDREIEKMKALVRDKGDEWYIFAKSIGTIVALQAVDARAITPAKCVFFGMPFNLVAESVSKGNWDILTRFSVPGLALHNNYDPTADYVFTKEKLLAYAKTIKLVTLSGKDHSYQSFNDFETEIKQFLL